MWIYNSYLPKEVKKIKTPNKNDLLKCINILNKFVTYGWAIYPLGLLISLYDYTPETMLMRELVYNFGDLFNKIGFSGAITIKVTPKIVSGLVVKVVKFIFLLIK